MDNGTPHIEYVLQWISFLLVSHGNYLKVNATVFAPSFRGLTKVILKYQETMQKMYEKELVACFFRYSNRLGVIRIKRCYLILVHLEDRRNLNLKINRKQMMKKQLVLQF